MKKSLVILLLLFFVVGALITITNFSTKAVALAPEVEGQWVDDESCGPGGWRCWEHPCHTCWCRDVASGQCCN